MLSRPEEQLVRGNNGVASITSPIHAVQGSDAPQSELLLKLKREADCLCALNQDPQISSPLGFHLVVSRMHAVAAAARQCASAGLSRDAMGHALEALRNVCMQSPFTKHVTEWPRGYAGDFSVIDQICWQRNHAKPGTLAFWVEQYSLGCGIAQQHRNKVSRQAGEILACAREKAAQGNEARIAILASGSSPDLQLIQTELSELPVHLVLVDSDPEAIRTSRERLPALTKKIDFVCGSVLTDIAGLSRNNPFDLVVAGGLFDYLNDRAATFLIKTVYTRVLADEGKFFFTNIGPDNPFADWTQYVTNWWLIHRSERDVDNLVAKTEVHNILLEYERDLTGLTLLITIKRKAEIP